MLLPHVGTTTPLILYFFKIKNFRRRCRFLCISDWFANAYSSYAAAFFFLFYFIFLFIFLFFFLFMHCRKCRGIICLFFPSFGEK